MKSIHIAVLAIFLLAGCGRDERPAARDGSPGPGPGPQPGKSMSLAEARKGFKTVIPTRPAEKEPVPDPPPNVFRKVQYDAPPGKLAAYLTPDPKDGKKHPAIIWITGGDCNSIGEVWGNSPENNEQTASAYRKAGIVMMFPSLRGGNDNPGVKESFLGEVDDVLAAADYLGKQPYVDPGRIYLGGHSTGGTLVLLVAECSDRFRAVFSFGPADDVRGYGPEYVTFDASNPKEAELRSPVYWLKGIRSAQPLSKRGFHRKGTHQARYWNAVVYEDENDRDES